MPKEGKMKRILLLMTVLSLMMIGCSRHVGNFSALATGTYNTEKVNKSHLVLRNATGKACQPVIIMFNYGYPKLDEAVSEALAANNGDYMMNARVYWTEWYIPFIYGSICFKVEGDVYKSLD